MPGSRDSQWHVLRRCLHIIVTLMHTPASKQELIAISTGEDNLSPTAADSRLQKDLIRLRDNLGCTINYDPQRQLYRLDAVETPLLDLSPNALHGLAFLRVTFHDDAPMGMAVQQTIDEITSRLPAARRDELRRRSHSLMLDLSPKDDDEIADAVWEIVQFACEARRLLEFDYFSPGHTDGQPRHNLVEPYRLYFDTGRSHYYLHAFCREVSGPNGTWPRADFSDYRLGRIRDPQILPDHFAPRAQQRRRYLLTYELIPQIARYGVTRHFPDSTVTHQEDGSAEVRAYVNDLFMPLKTLLHYGPGCRVTGGEEAVARMRELVAATWSIYKDK